MKSLLIALVLATGGYFGFQHYQAEQNSKLNSNPSYQEQQLLDKQFELAHLEKKSENYEKAIETYKNLLNNPQATPRALKELTAMLTEIGKHREALTLEYSYCQDEASRKTILNKINTLNEKLFNPNTTFGGTRHVIQPGETLAKIAKKYGSTERLLKRINKIENPHLIHSGKAIKVVPFKLSCQVNLKRHELIAYNQNEIFKVYRIGIGSPESPTPEGTFYVEVMQKDPPFWSEPGQAPIPSGNPDNPLGSRWLGFGGDFRSYGIHGTNEKDSIGKPSSQGCIRMSKYDVEELFDLADYGMSVEIF